MGAYRHRCAVASVTLCAALAAGFGGPATVVAQALAPSQLAGACYDILMGPWRQPTDQLRADSIFIAPPSRVRFDTARSERQPDRFVLSTPLGALPSVHRMAYWWPLGSDSVALVWSTGYSGLRMRLGGEPAELRGEARAFWDFPRDPLTAGVTARRVLCDVPARPGVANQRFVIRAVGLEGGDSVALGTPFAAIRDRADSVRGRTFRMRRAPAGLFVGAKMVDVSRSIGDTIRRVEVTYAADAELESLVSRLSSTMGAPVSRDTSRLDAPAGPGRVTVTWSNRTTTLWLSRSRLTAGGWRVTAVLVDPRFRP
jgi:hypothetical protein